MIQGTGSNVGKSMLVAGLARLLTNQGLVVRPFKPQNMSNNAAVTEDGGEIGRAQALQALAAKCEPHTDMNPVLLKPENMTGSQVVVQGHRIATVKARDYAALKPKLMTSVMESFRRLEAQADIVLVEGAGSPAEVNLRAGDIANMGFAEAANVPVILTGDIDRGGVIAQMVGTHTVLSPTDEQLIKGYIINKFRGDVSLFGEGNRLIEERTRWPSLGIIPWFADAHRLPAEDSVDIVGSASGEFKVAVPRLPSIANFDDIDPLKAEPGVSVEFLNAGIALPADTNLVLIPGSKSTISDLEFLRAQGWDTDILAHHRRGGAVVGLCGGYQILGRRIDDPDALEGEGGSVEGLGLLDVETRLSDEKTLTLVKGHSIERNAAFRGYEIHLGRTDGPDTNRPWLKIGDSAEGAMSADGRVKGSYVHGIFTSDEFRRDFLESFGTKGAQIAYEQDVQRTLDNLAAHISDAIDVDAFLAIARSKV